MDLLEDIMNLAENFLDDKMKSDNEKTNIINDHVHTPVNTIEYTLCSECGVVLSCIISDDNEEFTKEEQTINSSGTRCSSVTNELFSKSSLSTGISGTGRMQRLGKWLKFDYTDIVMFETLDLFNNAVAEMRLSSYIAQNSAKIYKEIFLYKQDDKKMILRGKNKSAVLAVCFYEISKTEIGLSDILNFFKIDLKVFDKTRRLLQGYNLISNQIEVFSKEYIHRICNKLNLHIKVIDLVCKIYEYVSFSDIQITTDHQILAYSVIYFVLTEMDDKIFIDNMKNIYKLNIDYVIKNHFILVKNKIRIFNHIKQNK